MNYRVIWPVTWIIMNLWLMLIAVLGDNQLPRWLSISVGGDQLGQHRGRIVAAAQRTAEDVQVKCKKENSNVLPYIVCMGGTFKGV